MFGYHADEFKDMPKEDTPSELQLRLEALEKKVWELSVRVNMLDGRTGSLTKIGGNRIK